MVVGFGVVVVVVGFGVVVVVVVVVVVLVLPNFALLLTRSAMSANTKGNTIN